jgi:hypothetical protein
MKQAVNTFISDELKYICRNICSKNSIPALLAQQISEGLFTVERKKDHIVKWVQRTEGAKYWSGPIVEETYSIQQKTRQREPKTIQISPRILTDS